MTRRSYARLDRYRQPNCDNCRIYPAVVGNLCVRCDHERWQAEKAAQERAAALAAMTTDDAEADFETAILDELSMERHLIEQHDDIH